MYIALAFHSDVLPVLRPGCLHVSLGRWELPRTRVNLSQLFHRLQCLLAESPDLWASLTPYGRHNLHWLLAPYGAWWVLDSSQFGGRISGNELMGCDAVPCLLGLLAAGKPLFSRAM